ncbi:gliding motility-associated C-terminal domain-containing protein, partial [Mariniflexile sp. HMF6888]|uniref:T9SS type B sorting domain-containing protein n=1 Tax=Mariniflexile sp. HMF6888 TaxID=3373086 RepID=UPI00379B8FE0
SFGNAAMLATPEVPTISSVAATCSAAGTSTITNYSASNTYTFSPTGPTVEADGSVSGMALGTSYTVTSGNGNCTSVASDSFSNAAMLATPEVPILGAVTQPSCTGVAGSFIITNYDTNYTYTFIPSAGVTNTLGVVTAPAGTYTVTAISGSGCVSVASASVTLTNCIDAVDDDYAPSISIIKTGIFNDSNNDGYAQPGETITYSFTITNTGNVPLTNVTITDPLPGLILTGSPIPILGVGETNNSAYTAVYPVTLNDIQLGLVINQATVTGYSNETTVESSTEEQTTLNEEPIVLPESDCVIEVYNAITPNGDNENEFLKIDGLECYPDNKVEIYNRWGVLVFERSGYNNLDKAFNGMSEGRVTVNQSKLLPAGTYFYILTYKDNNAKGYQKTGYLYLSR